MATWTGDGDGTSWYDSANWDIGVVPASYVDSSTTPATYVMYSVALPAGANVVHGETTATVLEHLTVENGATLQVNAGALDVRSLDGFNEALDGFGTINLAGQVTVGGSFTRLRSHGITVDGDLILTSRGAYEIYSRKAGPNLDRTISGTGTINFDHTKVTDRPSFSYVGGGGVITFPSSLSIQGSAGTFNADPDSTLLFQGPISVTGSTGEILIGHGPGGQKVVMDNVTTVDGGDIHFFAEEMINQGTISATNGGRLEASFPNPFYAAATYRNEGTITVEDGELSLDTAWTNPGTITTTNTATELRGTFSTAEYESLQRTASPVEINGVMDNTGDTYLVDHSDGEVVLAAGKIVGGTVDARNESIRTVSSGSSILQDVTYQGDMSLIGGVNTRTGVGIDGSITFDPATDNLVTLSGAGLTFNGPGDVWMDGNATVILDPTLKANSNQSWINLGAANSHLTIGSGISISGESAAIGFASADGSQLTIEGSIAATGTGLLNIGLGSGVNTTVNRGQITVNTNGQGRLGGEFFHNEGLIEVLAGGYLEYRDVNNSTLIKEYLFENRSGGTIQVGSAATFSLFDTLGNPVMASNSGLWEVAEGGVVVSEGDPTPITNLGQLTGSGTFATDIENRGQVVPGGSTGVLTIDGDVLLTADGTLDVDVAGQAPGTEHDQLSVTGDVSLGGELAVTADPAYTPPDGETLTIITSAGAAGVDGVFDTQTGGFTGNDRYLAPSYHPDRVDLVVGDPPNRPPVIEPIPEQAVDEETTLTVPIAVSDPDGDDVTFSLIGEPDGAAIVDGDLVWTPTESQGPGSFSFEIVADDGRGGTDREPVTVSVLEVNQAPVVDPIDDITVGPGELVTFTATATDPDIPENQITWRLAKGAPPGAGIDATTGEFSWLTPETTDRYTIGIIATDDGNPPLEGTIFFSITVDARPVLITVLEQIGVRESALVRHQIRLSEQVGIRDLPHFEQTQIFVVEPIGLADLPIPTAAIRELEYIGIADDPSVTTISSGTVSGLRDVLSGSQESVTVIGDEITFQGDGFEPLTEITVELLSDPILLGMTTAGGDGSFSTAVIIPAVKPGEHLLRAVGNGPGGNRHEVHFRLTVVYPAEVTLLEFEPGVEVSEPGGTSGPFDLEATITTEYEQDSSLAEGNPNIRLVPIGPGETIDGECGFDGTLLTCGFDQVPVNTYLVQAYVAFPYNGSDEGVLVVSDPSLGFTNGAGWFYWPGTEDKTSFGYNTQNNKKQTNLKGSLLVIRHVEEGNYRVKSNALDGLSLGSEEGFDWASFAGKATYQEPGWAEPIGAHEFVFYAEDVTKGADRVWLRITDKDGNEVTLAMPLPAPGEAVELGGGNILVPRGVPEGVE